VDPGFPQVSRILVESSFGDLVMDKTLVYCRFLGMASQGPGGRTKPIVQVPYLMFSEVLAKETAIAENVSMAKPQRQDRHTLGELLHRMSCPSRKMFGIHVPLDFEGSGFAGYGTISIIARLVLHHS